MAVRHDIEVVQHEIFDPGSSYTGQVRELLLPVLQAVVDAKTPEDYMGAQLEVRDLLAGRQAAMEEIKASRTADKDELADVPRDVPNAVRG